MTGFYKNPVILFIISIKKSLSRSEAFKGDTRNYWREFLERKSQKL
jgi:hypothetical protein